MVVFNFPCPYFAQLCVVRVMYSRTWAQQQSQRIINLWMDEAGIVDIILGGDNLFREEHFGLIRPCQSGLYDNDTKCEWLSVKMARSVLHSWNMDVVCIVSYYVRPTTLLVGFLRE